MFGGEQETETQKHSEPQTFCRHHSGLVSRPCPQSLVPPTSSRMLGLAEPTGLVVPVPEPSRRAATRWEAHRKDSHLCFINSSSHFQRLANSSGHAARPLRASGKDAA